MNFDDTPQEAAFRAEARAWIDANAPKHLHAALAAAGIGEATMEVAQQVAALLQAAGGRGPIRMFLERGGAVYSTDFRIS